MAGVDDLAFWRGRVEATLRLMPDASSCEPQAAHMNHVPLSTDFCRVIHIGWAGGAGIRQRPRGFLRMFFRMYTQGEK